jgi:hypothetical protein
MVGLRVGVELRASTSAVTAVMATLPWMAPERIALDSHRCLMILVTSLNDPEGARAYAERRVQKSATGLGLDVTVLSTEAFPALVDLTDGADRLI